MTAAMAGGERRLGKLYRRFRLYLWQHNLLMWPAESRAMTIHNRPDATWAEAAAEAAARRQAEALVALTLLQERQAEARQVQEALARLPADVANVIASRQAQAVATAELEAALAAVHGGLDG